MEFIDLKAQYKVLKCEIDANIQNVLNSAQFIGGSYVKELESQLAAFVGRKYCISCGNGTEALQLAFMAYGIGRGDAVFCPDVTFIASIEPACMLGATPIFCDITSDTYNLCSESLERQIKAVLAEGKLTPKMVIAVDFLGNPADFAAISAVCKKYDLILLEDAAQGFGASYMEKRCCSYGDIATTSFFPAKPLGCYGDGGAIFTDDDEVNQVCRSLCVHGKGPGGKYDNVRIGLNSRLDNLQAAILLPKLKALKNHEMEKRQIVAAAYNSAFAEMFLVPYVAEGSVSSYAQYALLAANQTQRDQILAHLTEKKVPSMIYYPTPQHLLPVFKNAPLYGETFSNAVNYCTRTFSLPMHPYLETAEQKIIINSVLEAI